ncbi:MmpS family transport accessory protein [Actinosynnema sp. CS-041913]|uniref:MmpS family transport accessory protein n=1 Tax=Actinosynnema sp. CS-041913 TaxID=3239917 RepID=UPI003D8F0C4E
MAEADLPGPDGRPAQRWPVLVGAAVLVLGALALAVWVARPADQPSVVVYEVSGETRRATVTYSTFDERDSPTRQVELTTFPWYRELRVDGDVSDGVLTVTIGAEGGSVACKISVDGVERKAATATGPLTSALCNGF